MVGPRRSSPRPPWIHGVEGFNGLGLGFRTLNPINSKGLLGFRVLGFRSLGSAAYGLGLKVYCRAAHKRKYPATEYFRVRRSGTLGPHGPTPLEPKNRPSSAKFVSICSLVVPKVS